MAAGPTPPRRLEIGSLHVCGLEFGRRPELANRTLVIRPRQRGLQSTGDPGFCAPWSFARVPTIALPSGLAGDGLPLAVQLVGRPWREAELLGVARRLDALLNFDRALAL